MESAVVHPSFRGQVAVVSGGASGIGSATVRGFAEEGAKVAILDRNERAAQALAADLRDQGAEIAVIPVDLARVELLAGAIDEAVRCLGPIRFLVNCAGVNDGGGFLEMTPEVWDRIMAVNLRAAMFLSQAVARHMIAQGTPGRIVNVASGHAVRAGLPVAYCCSKAGLAHLTRVSARALGPHGINVNTVAPGLTDTPMIAEGMARYRRQIEQGGELGNMLNRMSEPEDVADAILFLCAPGSRQITAQIVHTGAGSVY
ncbi:SDR family NAD(P)-dependent oxidoreductase [Paralimibaculum aggregatum]|uniref:SDR family NAD(P)-dependent oxidoreductase n=1 Tax=Paralimibaculum aggregatum TaxID=3036245 RepID=A0ABQ6LLJ1_9RHOB|nr:SDR family oxidoreductase [Limibaculum sp. NKW23]GMG82108.1 SDR family NAD(P)-dependent oxidoreductase [Limibaculum sp. NKW23]